MDHALAFVQAYLHVNGFFTVSEYPVLEEARGGFREVTDIDLLAVRMGYAGKVLPRGGRPMGPKMEVDPVLGCPYGQTEFLVVEVKEGTGDMNRAMLRPAVLFEAMRRFGMCDREHLRRASLELAETGEAQLPGGRVRLLSFASRPPDKGDHDFIPLDHVVRFLQQYLRAHWAVNRTTRFRDQGLGVLALLEKASPNPGYADDDGDGEGRQD